MFGRSLLLLISEVLANAICWILAGIIFGRRKSTQPILSLALLAWVRAKWIESAFALTFIVPWMLDYRTETWWVA